MLKHYLILKILNQNHTQIHLRQYLKEVYTNGGRALVIATHALGKINHLASRLVLMDEGKIINTTYDIDAGVEQYLAICKKLEHAPK